MLPRLSMSAGNSACIIATWPNRLTSNSRRHSDSPADPEPAYFVAEAVTPVKAFEVTGLSPASKYLVFVTAVGPGGSNIPFGVRFTTSR